MVAMFCAHKNGAAPAPARRRDPIGENCIKARLERGKT